MFGVLGLEHATVRRVPWVSIALATAMLLASIEGWSKPPPSPEALDAAKAAVDFRLDHPEVKISEKFRETFPGAVFLMTMPDRVMHMPGLPTLPGPPPVDPDVAASDQATFDGLARHALSLIHPSVWQRYGLWPSRGLHQLGLVTHVFLVTSVRSLVIDLLMLYLVALVLEDVFGRPLFLALFFGGAVVSAAVTLALAPDATYPVLGPMGALGACFGAFVVRFRSEKLMVRLTRDGPVQLLPAWTWGAVWLGRVLLRFSGIGLFAAVLPGGGFLGHAGALVFLPQLATVGFGVAVALVVARFKFEARFVDPVVEGEAFEQHPAVLAATEALALGNLAGARDNFEAALKDDPGNVDALLGLLRLAVDQRDPAAAHRYLDRLLTGCLARKDADTIELGFQELGANLDPAKLRPATAYKVAMDLGDRLGPQIRERLFRSGGSAQGLLGAKSRLAAADLDLNALGRPADARALALQVLSQPGLDASLAARAQAIVDAAPQSASGLELGGGMMAAAGGGMLAAAGGAAFAPSGLALATAPAPRPTLRATPARFAGRTADGYRMQLPDGRTVALPAARIREIAAGVLDRLDSEGGTAANIVVLDLVVARRTDTVQCLRLDSRAMGVETLFQGLAPTAAFRALVAELFKIPGITLRPANLARGLPRFPDLAAFEAAAYP